MEHNHSHNNDINLSNAFRTSIAINIIFITIEALFGFLSNSMALLADAGHNLSDVLALAFSWIAVILSQRKPTLKFTYGFRRSTILIALLNTILLLVAVCFILYETVERLKKPTDINANSVMIVAALGIGVNAFTARLFMRGKKHDLNIRSAFLHFVADALVFLGVVVAGIIMAFTGTQWIDSLVSFAIILVILYSSYHLLIDSVNLALDVYEQEEKLFYKDLSEIVILDDKISRLMTFPNVLITAHQAYFTDIALTQIAQTTIQNLSDFENGVINPQNQVCINMVK